MSTSTTKNEITHIKYFGVSDDLIQKGFVITHYSNALDRGPEFKLYDNIYTLAPLSELAFYMHKHAPRLHVKMHSTFQKTIAEMYEFDYHMLYDLLLLKGGKMYLGQILAGVEELYNQEQKLEQWEESQM
jgi:hypothetical protein